MTDGTATDPGPADPDPLPSEGMGSWWVRRGRPAVVAAIGRAGRWPVLPPVLVALIFGCDLAMEHARSRLAIGLLDEPAHLATAVLALLAVLGGRRLAAAPAFTSAAVVAACAIDVDHVPLYAGVPGVADVGSRPYSHSLLTVLLLAVAWLVTGRRWPVLAGAAAGVTLHFVRDVATGPGLQLWWPFGHRELLPYRWYVGLIVVLAVVAAIRAWRCRLSARS